MMKAQIEVLAPNTNAAARRRDHLFSVTGEYARAISAACSNDGCSAVTLLMPDFS